MINVQPYIDCLEGIKEFICLQIDMNAESRKTFDIFNETGMLVSGKSHEREINEWKEKYIPIFEHYRIFNSKTTK